MATEADVRRIALSLPETTEETWYRTPGYKVAGKGFLRFRTEAEGGLVVFVLISARSSPCSIKIIRGSSPRRTTTTTPSCW